MRHSLFEVIRFGSDLSPEGPNGPDTCFLVRANSVEEASSIADNELMNLPHNHIQPFATVVYLLGEESIGADEPKLLRGPYYHHAYSSGWPTWEREKAGKPWLLRDS